MAWNGTFSWLPTRTTADSNSAADINLVDSNSEQLWANIQALGGNGTSEPARDMTELNDAINAVVSTSIKTATADYTILDGDGYTDILVNPTTGNVIITLPTAADNTNRQINIKVTHAGGLVTVDGEGAETIDGSASIYLNGQYDRISILCDGTEWFIKELISTFDTGWISRSDWTNVHCGSVELTYDNLGGGGFTVGEKITEATSGYTGIIVADSGTVLKLKNVTGGFFTNDRQITGATSGETADVNGDTKNQDTNVFHQLNAGLPGIYVDCFYSSDGTDGNALSILEINDTALAVANNYAIRYPVDTNNVIIQTGENNVVVGTFEGKSLEVDTEDSYYKVIVRRVI